MNPDNIRINVLSASKSSQTDSFDGGCDPCTCKHTDISARISSITYPTIAAAFQEIVKDNTVAPDQITTIDPNIYQDRKDGSTRTVEDNTAAGCYRCTFNRTENSHGRKPTADEDTRWRAGEIDLKLADYDIYFTLSVVNLDESELAKLVNCGNW